VVFRFASSDKQTKDIPFVSGVSELNGTISEESERLLGIDHLFGIKRSILI
jgi:hypothetical protein